MKKLIIFTVVFIFFVSPIFAATNDFTADADITVSAVTFGATTADMLIINGSTAESWTFDSGSFTITNPGTFKVGSSDALVKAIKVTQGGTNLVCTENSSPGISYATAPTASGIYTIEPSSTTDCTSLCTAVANAASYNSFPTCGAATCNSGYTVSGAGANATCITTGGGVPISILQKMNEANKTPIPTAPETTTGSTQPETTPAPATTVKIEYTLEEMKTEAKIIDSYSTDNIAGEVNETSSAGKEETYKKLAEDKIILNANITADNKKEIIDFITYGTMSTKKIGAGERAGTVNSFKAAFNKLPTTEADWNDVIKIANGRWPSQISKLAEDKASINFEKVYKRKPDMKNKKDETAIKVMAYGLRPANRNLNSEAAAIKSFKAIYGYSPQKATAWDVVRAIAYSGATR